MCPHTTLPYSALLHGVPAPCTTADRYEPWATLPLLASSLAVTILWIIQSTSVRFCLDEFTTKDNFAPNTTSRQVALLVLDQRSILEQA